MERRTRGTERPRARRRCRMRGRFARWSRRPCAAVGLLFLALGLVMSLSLLAVTGSGGDGDEA